MPITTTTPFALSKGLSLSKARVEGLAAFAQGFDKLSPNGVLTTTPFALSKGLSLSKARVEGLVACAQGFDKLSPERDFFFEAGPSIAQDERVGLNANNNDNT